MSPARVRWPRLHRIADLAAESRLKENLALILCIYSIVLGVLFIWDGASFLSSPSFTAAFMLASPAGWGALFTVLGVAPLVTLRRPEHNVTTAWLLRGQTITFAVFAASFAISRVYYGGLISGAVAYLLPSAMSALIALVYRHAEVRRG